MLERVHVLTARAEAAIDLSRHLTQSLHLFAISLHTVSNYFLKIGLFLAAISSGANTGDMEG